MPQPRFHLEVSFNETTGQPVAAYLRVREGPVAQTREISDGVAFADYAADGSLLGLELLAPCDAAVIDRLAEGEPPAVQQFLRDSVRRPLAFAG